MAITLPAGMKITGEILPAYEDILTPEALALVDKLHRAFEPAARNCWPRVERAKRLDAGEMPDFLPETKTSAKATGRSRRCRRRWNAAAWKSPARSKPRWSSTPSTRALTAT
jgi:malate synthase